MYPSNDFVLFIIKSINIIIVINLICNGGPQVHPIFDVSQHFTMSDTI